VTYTLYWYERFLFLHVHDSPVIYDQNIIQFVYIDNKLNCTEVGVKKDWPHQAGRHISRN
jgi:hypothetical protein